MRPLSSGQQLDSLAAASAFLGMACLGLALALLCLALCPALS